MPARPRDRDIARAILALAVGLALASESLPKRIRLKTAKKKP